MATAPTAEAFEALEEKVRGLTESLRDANKNALGFGSGLGSALKQVGTGVTGFATAMANGQQGASTFNGVINSAGSALGTVLKEIGPLGTAFSKLTDFAAVYLIRANQQSDALFKSFQDLSRVGGAGAEGMKGVFSNMQQFGLTMDQLPEFGAMIAQNSEALAVMGGTVAEGTKQFAGVAAGIQQSGLQSEFMRMGLNTKSINEGTANYLRIQTLTSAGAVKSTEQLTAGAAEYIYQQDKLSRLTGKSADTLAKEEQTRMANERYSATQLELQMKADALRAAGDETGAKAAENQIVQNRELLARTPAALKQGVQDLMSGFVNSPEAQKMYIALPEMSQAIIQQNFAAAKVLESGAKEADANTKRNIGLAKAGGADKVMASFSGQRELAQLKAGAADITAKKEQTTQATGAGDVDVNNQVAMRQAQIATTQALDQLVNKGVGPLTEQMKNLSVGIERIITAIPDVNPKTATAARPGESNSGRGENTPAIAGYTTNFNPEDFAKFLDKAFKALTGPTTPVVPPATTGGAARDALFGSNTTGPRTPVATPATTGAQARDALLGVPNTTGPNTTYRTNLSDTTPTNAPAAAASQESAARGNADLTQGIMTLAQNIGSQTTSMNELVELMRRSNGIQDKILQQARN